MNIADFNNLHRSLGSGPSFRAKYMEMFLELGLPQRKQEAWRYANIASWNLPQELTSPSNQAASITLPAELTKDADIVNYNGNIIVLKDVPGVKVQSVLEVDIELVAKKVSDFSSSNSFIAYTLACLTGGMYIKVEENLEYIPRIKILNYKDKNVFVNELNWIEVGEGSKLELCSEYYGSSSYWLSSINYASLAKNSSFTSEVLQNESDNAISHSASIVMQNARSIYRQQEFACGAKVSRSEYVVNLNEEGASADIAGVNHVKADSWHNTNIMLKHMANNCISRQNFRTILHKQSVGAFLGHIYVPKGVTGSEAYQDSKNMLLSAGARAIAKPYLEIYADDVVCTHSATVGQLDKDMMFFLLSRGLSKDSAKLLLIKSFILAICSEDSGMYLDVIKLISDYNATGEEICKV